MKKFISLLLAVVLAFSVVPAVSAEEGKIVYLNCGGNLFDIQQTEFLIKDNTAYIKNADAALFTGYSVKNDAKFLFERDGKEITIPGIVYGNKNWVPFDEAMYNLYAEFWQFDGGFYIRGLEHTFEELIKVADGYLFGGNGYWVTDMSEWDDTRAIFGSLIYGFITSFGSSGYLTGQHQKDVYKEVIQDLVNPERNDGLLESLSNIEDSLDTLKTMNDLIDDKTFEDVMEVFDTITDLTGTATEAALGVGVEGLDLFSQLEIYKYIETLYSGHSTLGNMIYYTYMPQLESGYNIPTKAKEAINDFVTCYNDKNAQNLINLYLLEEANKIINATGQNTMQTIIANYIGNGALATILASIKIQDLVYNELFNINAKFEFAEKNKCLYEMQNGIFYSYTQYKYKPEFGINAKYAAMLFLRCSQLSWEYYEAAEKTELATNFDMYIAQLAEFSDRDLTFEPVKQDVDMEQLIKNASENNQKDDHINEENRKPVYTVLVLDSSGESSFLHGDEEIYVADTAIEYVKDASGWFLDNLAEASGDNYVAVVSYKEYAELVSDYTQDYSFLKDKIYNLSEGENIRSITEGLKTAEHIINGIEDEDAIKNIVLFTTGMTNTADYSYEGRYNEDTVGSNWYREGTGINLYAYSNTAYEQAQKMKKDGINIYTIGLFQVLENMPEEGENIVEFFELFAKDLATAENAFYYVDNPEDLEFYFDEVLEDMLSPKKDWAEDFYKNIILKTNYAVTFENVFNAEVSDSSSFSNIVDHYFCNLMNKEYLSKIYYSDEIDDIGYLSRNDKKVLKDYFYGLESADAGVVIEYNAADALEALDFFYGKDKYRLKDISDGKNFYLSGNEQYFYCCVPAIGFRQPNLYFDIVDVEYIGNEAVISMKILMDYGMDYDPYPVYDFVTGNETPEKNKVEVFEMENDEAFETLCEVNKINQKQLGTAKLRIGINENGVYIIGWDGEVPGENIMLYL